MTVLERLNMLAVKISFTEEQKAQFLQTRGLSATADWTPEVDDRIWLTFADMLEVFASNFQDYSQGEVNETIAREALLELAHSIRMRYLPASKSEIYYDEEVGNAQW